MIAVCALLAAVAVALLIPPDNAVRLRSMGLGRMEYPPSHSLESVVARFGFGPGSRRRLTNDRLRGVEALAALASELRGGQPLSTALTNAAGSPPVWPATLAALRLDGDVSEALTLDAANHPVLASLAACWQVSSTSGNGLAIAVDRLAASARSSEEIRVELESQLAGPRATARMLATLPLIGLAMGIMMGADPLGWLTGTAIGVLCLAAGVALTGAGIFWTSRIAETVERLL